MYRKPIGHYGFFRASIAKLQLQSEDLLLEIGCGGGALLDMVQQTVRRAWAVDYSLDMVELARKKNEKALSEERVVVVQGNVEALPWPENHFTCEVGVEMLYFIEHPTRALEELYRVLKSGGRLVLTTAAQPQSALARLLSAPWLRYLRFYPSDELADMLRQAGFQTVQVERVDRSKYTIYAHQLAYAVK
jgi:ubiquinone/menaquinone biosynthesis C-methylase UbiE